MAAPPGSVRPSTRRGRREERDAARRLRLLDTGLEVFGTEGYAGSAIEDLCARAGVGTRSFYVEFESKEDLLLAVYDRVIAEVTAPLAQALSARAPADVAAYVRGAVDAFVGHVTADERAARVQLIEVVGVSPRLERHRREVIRGFAGLVERETARLHAAGHIPRAMSPLLCLALTGGANELLTDWLLAERRPSRRRLVDELAHLHVSAVLGPAPNRA